MRVNTHATDPELASSEGIGPGVGLALTAGPAPDPTDALSFVGEMTISRAGELKSLLLASVERAAAGRTVQLNLAGVTELDSSGVQLLLLARHLAAARHSALRLSACSPAVRQVLALMHLSATFDVLPSFENAAGPTP